MRISKYDAGIFNREWNGIWSIFQKTILRNMNKIIIAAAAACIALLAVSCQTKMEEPTGEANGSLYGTWVFDTYKIVLSGNVDGNDGAIPVTIPYVFKKTTLSFSEDGKATAHMGWEYDRSKFTYNAENRTVTFDEMLEVSDDGMVMILAGKFDVVELTDEKLVLKQPYVEYENWKLPSGTTVSSSASSWYTYHRESK